MEHTRESIRALLQRSNKAVERAMVVLHERQTSDEKAASVTRHTNQRGFSAAHAHRGSYYARWVLSGRNLTGHHLTSAREIALHYVGQLLDEAERKSMNAVAKEVLPPIQVLRPTVEDVERQMQEIEANGDRTQTLIDEVNKFLARSAMERG